MSSYQQQLMDKVEDLQQQTRFCLNNYDYHHRNNEFQVLQENQRMVRSGARVFKEFLHNIDALQSTLAEVAKECDKVDEFLLKYGITKNGGTEDGHDGGSDKKQHNEHASNSDKENKRD